MGCLWEVAMVSKGIITKVTIRYSPCVKVISVSSYTNCHNSYHLSSTFFYYYYFAHIISGNTHPHPIRKALSLCSFYRWEKWGSKRVNNWPTITQMRWEWNPHLSDPRSKSLTTQYCKFPVGRSWVLLIRLGLLAPGSWSGLIPGMWVCPLLQASCPSLPT